jgi:Na+-translocating ferredoxin:NAD+ oxidoreductase subunit D
MMFAPAPFLLKDASVSQVMTQVCLALIPGIAAYAWLVGPAILVQLVIASLTAVAAEAVMLKLRGKPLALFLSDGSAIVTAWLIALTFPPLAPWWLVVTGTLFAIVIAKHLYGGLGQNPFNPAMVAFAVCIVSFPALMSQWPSVGLQMPLLDQIDIILGLARGSMPVWRNPAGRDEDSTEVGRRPDRHRPPAGQPGHLRQLRRARLGMGRRRLPDRRPVAVAAQADHLACAGRLPGGNGAGFRGALAVQARQLRQPAVPSVLRRHHARRLLHHHRPGFRLHDTARQADLRFLCAGLLAYIIRVFGGYPDGVAFAVLLMNLSAPLIDQLTQPRIFGMKGRQS